MEKDLLLDDRRQAIPATAQGGCATMAQAAASPPCAKPFRQMSAQPRLHPDGQTAAQQYRRFRRDARYARYKTVQTLVAQGVSYREIARRMGLSRDTVTRFAQAEVFPELPPRAAHPRGSRLAPFKAYVRHRCQQGCWNGSQLYAEIHAQGFAGSLSLLRHYLTELRKQQPVVAEVSATTVLPHKASILEPYKPYLLHRWQEGCWNGQQLYAEIRTQGYPGSQPTVRNFLTDVRQKQHLVGTAVALQWDAAQRSVVLSLALERYMNRCAELARRRRQAQGMMPKIIPYLLPPPGAQQYSRISGGGWREVDSAAVLTTTLGLEAVAAHYGEQLRRAGWTQTDQGASGPLAWQTWHCISDEQQPWTGLFLALHTPKQPADYYLFVRASRNVPTTNALSSGGPSYGPTTW
jgi:transposase